MSRPEHPWLLPAALSVEIDPDNPVRPRRTARDWLVDVGAFLFSVAIYVLVMGVDLGVSPPRYPDLAILVDLLAGLVALGAIWLRRRWPVGVAVLIVPLTAVSATAVGAAVVALFTVAVHRRLAVAAGVAGLFEIASLIIYAWRPEPDTAYLTSVLVSTLLIAVVLAWGMFVRARRQLVLSLKDRAHRAEAEQRLRVEQARQLERTRIAREMHDVLAHRISLLSLHAGALEFRPDAPPAEIVRAAGVIRDSAHQALQELREVIGVLRAMPTGSPDSTVTDWTEPPQPTLAELPALVAESRYAGMRVDLDVRRADLSAVPPRSARHAYRIIQEGLTNARKHAPGTAVEVSVAGAPGDGLTVEVRNPLPVGAVSAGIPGTGTGLVGLAERAHLAGGRLEHGRTGAGEFRLRAWLPWPS